MEEEIEELECSEAFKRRLVRLVDLGIVEEIQCQYESCIYGDRNFGEHGKRPCIDHILTRAAGGSEEEWNLRLLHIGCNSRKASQEDAVSRRRVREKEWSRDRRERVPLFSWTEFDRGIRM